ncbi:transposase [Streptomyces sp. NPDC086787]|uniref:transposase n=1 Tax=Streptomyces sp. NPDC086787 TaxID=3365759 RepID=UPI00382CA577
MFEDFFALLAGLWCRVEPRLTARTYLKALLGPVERKNTWQIAAYLGHTAPDEVKDLLRKTTWSWSGLRDRGREFVVAHLGDVDAVLVLDETAFLKKGDKSVGVAAQCAGPGRSFAVSSPSSRLRTNRSAANALRYSVLCR